MKNMRLYDKRYDGHRFLFKAHPNNICDMEDTLHEFPTISMPHQMGEVIARMLGDLHQYQQDEREKVSNLKSLIELAENTDIDKDVLKTIIKYGMDYKVEK